MIKTGQIRTRSGILTAVKSLRSIEHLDPKSFRHMQDQKYAAEIRQKLGQTTILNVSPEKVLSIPSLGGGLILDGTTLAPVSESVIAAKIQALNTSRRQYVVEERKPDGTLYLRRRTTVPVVQLGLTFFPGHSLMFDFLEREGVETAEAIKLIARTAAKEFRHHCAYELVAVYIHAEEAVLHLHLVICTVDGHERLLHPKVGVGRPAGKLLGIGLLGTMRLVDYGVWPDEDALFARNELKKFVGKRGEYPLDIRLSETIDGCVEKYVANRKTCKKTHRAYEWAMAEYTAFARARRRLRQDVLEEANMALTQELLKLQMRLEQLEQSKKTQACPVASSIPLDIDAVVASIHAGFRAQSEGTPLQPRHRRFIEFHDRELRLNRDVNAVLMKDLARLQAIPFIQRTMKEREYAGGLVEIQATLASAVKALSKIKKDRPLEQCYRNP